jgi:hypothetical protein
LRLKRAIGARPHSRAGLRPQFTRKDGEIQNERLDADFDFYREGW